MGKQALRLQYSRAKNPFFENAGHNIPEPRMCSPVRLVTGAEGPMRRAPPLGIVKKSSLESLPTPVALAIACTKPTDPRLGLH